MSVADQLDAVSAHAGGSAGQADPRSAQAALRYALDSSYGQLGKDHPEVLAATRVLAGLHRRTGQLSEARTLLEEALAAGRFTRGEGHVVMLGLAYDLALIADELENRHEARRNFTRLRRFGPAVLGPDHEYVRAAERYLSGAADNGATAGPGSVPPTRAATPSPAPAAPPPAPAAPPPAPAAPPPTAAAPSAVPAQLVAASPGPPSDQPEMGQSQPTMRLAATPPPSAAPAPPAPAPPAPAPPAPAPPAPAPAAPAPPAPVPPQPTPPPSRLPAATPPPPTHPPAATPPRAVASAPVPDRPPWTLMPQQSDPLTVPVRRVPAHRHGSSRPDRTAVPVDRPSEPRPSRTPVVVLLVTVGLLLAAGITTLVVLFLSSGSSRIPTPAPSTGSSSPPPIQLGLQDSGGAVTLNWTDPTGGRVPFVVAYGHADGPADRNQRLAPGTTTITINGLNPRLDYCFTVAGIESTSTITLSHAVCTRRGISTAPSAGGSLRTASSRPPTPAWRPSTTP